MTLAQLLAALAAFGGAVLGPILLVEFGQWRAARRARRSREVFERLGAQRLAYLNRKPPRGGSGLLR